jgi:ribosome-associated protein
LKKILIKKKAEPKPKKAALPKPKKTAEPKKSVPKKKEEISYSHLLARELAELALTKIATDVKILDLRNLTTITDFFVICTAHSDTQVKAVADAIMEGAKKAGERPWHKEGLMQKSWVLLDYVDVVVHIFLKDTREFYSLEKLWGDAPVEEIADV